MLTYEALRVEIEQTTALRKILPENSDVLSAVIDREKLVRADLALTPEHVEAQASWRRFGDWHRARSRSKRRAAPPVLPPSNHDHLGLYFVSMPSLDSA